jgi:class 3 adenylate cyclase
VESASARPTGTVTFLLTDIEGSTQLVKQLGKRYEGVLSDHQRILRAAFAENDGWEIDTQGDAFFVAFPRAKDAVGAAVAAQRGLAAHAWPEGAEVRVRMGLHTDEPVVGEARYVGLGVHRAARIAAAGHGGQVLLSNTTRELVEDDLPAAVKLIDLGEHRLKDIERPEHIAQAVIDGLSAVLTPLKSLNAQPAQATPFVDQNEKLAAMAEAALGVVSRQKPVAATRLRPALRNVLSIRPRPRSWRHISTLEGVGLRLYAAAAIAPEQLRTDVKRLGADVWIAVRAVREADELLAARKRKELVRQLSKYQNAAASEQGARTADAIGRQIKTLGVLRERRQTFATESRRLSQRLQRLPEKIFQSRIDSQAQSDLESELSEAGETLRTLTAPIQEACDQLLRRQAVRASSQVK